MCSFIIFFHQNLKKKKKINLNLLSTSHSLSSQKITVRIWTVNVSDHDIIIDPECTVVFYNTRTQQCIFIYYVKPLGSAWFLSYDKTQYCITPFPSHLSFIHCFFCTFPVQVCLSLMCCVILNYISDFLFTFVHLFTDLRIFLFKCNYSQGWICVWMDTCVCKILELLQYIYRVLQIHFNRNIIKPNTGWKESRLCVGAVFVKSFAWLLYYFHFLRMCTCSSGDYSCCPLSPKNYQTASYCTMKKIYLFLGMMWNEYMNLSHIYI